MTDREAMKMALYALEFSLPAIEDFGSTKQLTDCHRAIMALYKALAQPEQEPVRWFQQFGDTPPKREWVGLTQEEVQEIAKQLIDDAAYCSTHFAIAIEAELRRKNNAV